MELEELKQDWKLLSQRLDRQSVIRRQELSHVMARKMDAYMRILYYLLLLEAAFVPGAVFFCQHMQLPVGCIWLCVGILACVMSGQVREIMLFRRVLRCNGSLIETERHMVRYMVFLRGTHAAACILGVVLVLSVIICEADYYCQHGLWWEMMARLCAGAVVFVVIVGCERSHVVRLRQRIQELREFDDK